MWLKNFLRVNKMHARQKHLHYISHLSPEWNVKIVGMNSSPPYYHSYIESEKESERDVFSEVIEYENIP